MLASRLFALPLTDPGVIAELDPQSGAEVHRFNTPIPADPSGANGLAFDGEVLYYMPNDGTARLWQLDPDSGSVIRSDVVGPGSGFFDGLGVVDGKVYLQTPGSSQLLVFDPTSSTVVNQVNVAASLAGGLTGADHPDELVATENFATAVRIDPATGAVLGRFGLPGSALGAAFVDGKLYFGSAGTSQQGQLFVTDRTGNPLAILTTPYPVSALAGDGVEAEGEPEPEPGAERVINGGFETGTLSGWMTYTQPGSSGSSFHVYDALSTPTAPLLPPPQGNFAATSDLFGPGTQVLYQDVVLPAGQSANLSMLVAYRNQAAGFFTPGTLDFAVPGVANQQIRIDIVDPRADLLSTSANDVLLNLFQTRAGDPSSIDSTAISADLSAFAGTKVRLRIAIASNQNYLGAVVDAVSIQTGDVTAPPAVPTAYYVADLEDFGVANGKIIRIDAATGAQTIVSSGGQFIDPYGLVEAPDGSLIVVDQGPLGGTGALFRVDPATGAQTVISANGFFIDPFEVVIAPDGSYLVADFGTGGWGRVVRVDPVTGEQTLVSDGGMLLWPFGIASAPDGSIYVASQGYTGETGQVFRIDPTTGAQTLIATDGGLVDPQKLVVALDGSLIVVDPSALGGQGAIFRIDPATRNQTVILSGDFTHSPIRPTMAPDGRLIVGGPTPNSVFDALIAVDLATGEQTVVALAGPDWKFPNGIAVGVATPTTPPVDTPPNASAGGPYTVEEGAAVTLDASGTTDPDQDPGTLTYLWDLNGNGVFGETGSSATHGDEVGVQPVFSAVGLPGGSSVTVSLEVTDAKGQKSLAASTITIENRPPVVTLGPDVTINATDPFASRGSFTDPGGGENFRASVDYGDGAGLQELPLNPDRTFDLSHVYTRAGTYTVVVFVTDGNGGVDQSSLVVTVNPLTPVLFTQGDLTIPYGQDVVLLHGVIIGNAGAPQGDVAITLAGVTQVAAIDPATGGFNAIFSTATLGARDVPYTITYSYAGDGTYGAATVTSVWLHVEPRVLRIIAQSASKVYGEPDPTFSASFDGFAPGEGPNVLGGTLEFTTTGPAGNKPVGLYAITPSGLSSPNYAITMVPGALVVLQATTTFSELTPPTILVGTASAEFTGQIGSNSVLPVGQPVTATIIGATGPLASGTGIVGNDGRFSVTLATGALPVGQFTVRYEYAGDLNYRSAEGTAHLMVSTSVVSLYDTTKSYRAGGAVPIEIAVRDASGSSLASPSLVVTAVQLVDAQGATYPVKNVNLGGTVFRKTGSSYRYNLDTRGLAPGNYTLLVTIGDDPVAHALAFVVKRPGRFWKSR